MKGLLRKDLYMLWCYCRTFLILIPLFLAASYFQPDNFFFSFYPSIIISILPVTLMSYEERCKWNVFCQTLPIPRRQVVFEKYVLSAMGTSIISVLSAGIQYMIFRQSKPFHYEGYQATVAGMICIGLIAPSVLFPIVFKLGTEKGRLAYYFVLGGACAIGGFLSAFSENICLPQLSALAIVLISIVLFAASSLLSIKFYEKREL